MISREYRFIMPGSDTLLLNRGASQALEGNELRIFEMYGGAEFTCS